jgi:hypothetical protein
MDGASASDALEKLPPGNYLCEVTGIKFLKTTYKTNLPAYFIEFNVLESDSPEVRPGSPRSIGFYSAFDMSEKGKFKREKDQGRIKQFLAAVFSDQDAFKGLRVDPFAIRPMVDKSWDDLAEDTIDGAGAAIQGCKFRVNMSYGTSQGGTIFPKPHFKAVDE